jgi:hypothetical protein
MTNLSHKLREDHEQGGWLDWCGDGLGDPWGLLDAAPYCPCTKKRLYCVILDKYISCKTRILILTGVWNWAGSIRGNNRGGGARPYAARRLCMYWNISAILCWSAKRASRSAIILASISCHSLLSSSSWAYNISTQCYNNSKIRYITQGMTSYKSTNLMVIIESRTLPSAALGKALGTWQRVGFR